jgi:hypothetical protein
VIHWVTLGPGSYRGDVDGQGVARIERTGRPGVDDYPWDWYVIEIGRGAGVADTLRSAKAKVAEALGARRL